MSIEASDITGIVLAGGRGRRMGGQDKGLVHFGGQPLVCHALEALRGVAGPVMINANRNAGRYRQLGYPVIPDLTGRFDGPLAGLLSAFRAAVTPYVLTVPCDTPLLTGPLLRRLTEALSPAQAAIAVAHDGERLHPVILLAATRLADDLEAYLAAGERRVDGWIARHPWAAADYSDAPGVLANINTPETLAALEREGQRPGDSVSG